MQISSVVLKMQREFKRENVYNEMTDNIWNQSSNESINLFK